MIVFTYPGQGSQKPGMGEPWCNHPSWELVEEASEITGRDVAELLLSASMDELTLTHNSQLATYVLSMVVLDAVERTGLAPAMHAGHSLGEYSALTGAGVISFEEGVRLVLERGEAMQAAAEETPGTMAAVLGLQDDEVDLVCQQTEGKVWPANYNAPGQVIISGDPAAIEQAGDKAKQAGAKRVIAIKVGGAFHTPFMASARDRLLKAIEQTDFRDASSPIYANFDAKPYSEGTSWAELLAAGLTGPVMWRHTLKAIEQAGATTITELGPGATLTGLAKRTVTDCAAKNVSTPKEVDALLELVSHASESEAIAEGELLYAVERLVVSPTTGPFKSLNGLDIGAALQRGELIGHVGDTEVRSAFAGSLQGFLAMPGERVIQSQPLAWLRADSLAKPL